MPSKNTVAILMGGGSPEAEVSRKSAKTVSGILSRISIKHVLLEHDKSWLEKIKEINPNFVFLALHGSDGENGTVQQALENLNLPYQGSNPKTSALAMDKAKAKEIFESAGLTVAQGVIFNQSDVPLDFIDVEMELPVVVKPVNGGSTLGVSILKCESKWQKAFKDALQYDKTIMVEEYIEGEEYTVGLLDDKPLAVMKIIPQTDDFFTYEAKYSEDGSFYEFEKENTDLYNKLASAAKIAAQSLSCKDMSRADFIYDKNQDKVVILEINTLPGLNVLWPRMAVRSGLKFEEIIRKIVLP